MSELYDGLTPDDRSEAGRPGWLTLACVLLFAPALISLISGLCFGLLAAAVDSLGFMLYFLLPPLLLAMATAGLWRMRAWGGVTYFFYFGLEVLRNVASLFSGGLGVGGLPFPLAQCGVFLLDVSQAPALVAAVNLVYMLLAGWLAVRVRQLWRSGQLE